MPRRANWTTLRRGPVVSADRAGGAARPRAERSCGSPRPKGHGNRHGLGPGRGGNPVTAGMGHAKHSTMKRLIELSLVTILVLAAATGCESGWDITGRVVTANAPDKTRPLYVYLVNALTIDPAALGTAADSTNYGQLKAVSMIPAADLPFDEHRMGCHLGSVAVVAWAPAHRPRAGGGLPAAVQAPVGRLRRGLGRSSPLLRIADQPREHHSGSRWLDDRAAPATVEPLQLRGRRDVIATSLSDVRSPGGDSCPRMRVDRKFTAPQRPHSRTSFRNTRQISDAPWDSTRTRQFATSRSMISVWGEHERRRAITPEPLAPRLEAAVVELAQPLGGNRRARQVASHALETLAVVCPNARRGLEVGPFDLRAQLSHHERVDVDRCAANANCLAAPARAGRDHAPGRRLGYGHRDGRSRSGVSARHRARDRRACVGTPGGRPRPRRAPRPRRWARGRIEQGVVSRRELYALSRKSAHPRISRWSLLSSWCDAGGFKLDVDSSDESNFERVR